MLIAAGAEVNVLDSHKRSPLLLCCTHTHFELAKLLIQSGADVLQKDAYGRTHLEFIELKKIDVLLMDIVRVGAIGVNHTNQDGESVLWTACAKGNTDDVRYLLAAGVEVNVPNKLQETPLWIACEKQHYPIVKLLVDAGADPNITDMEGESPLFVASRNGNTAIVRELLRAGADREIKNNDGKTALDVAVEKCHQDVCTYLTMRAYNSNFLRVKSE